MGTYTFCISNPREGGDAVRAAAKKWDVVTYVSFDTAEQAVQFTKALSVWWRHVQVLKATGEIWIDRRG